MKALIDDQFKQQVEAIITRYKSALLACIHGDQGEQRLDCNCAYCWPEEIGNPDA